MKQFIREHKVLCVSICLLVIALIYTSSKTFLSNDDLPYMFFYRGEARVTNIIQAVKNQVADYMHINGRFFVHVAVQTLLIFDKHLWSVLNPLVIMALLLIMSNIVSYVNKEKSFNYKYFLVAVICFLLLYNYKYIIYWVSGSVNYIWVALVLIAFIYYYLVKGLDKAFLLNAFIILIVSILHEMALVFMIIFLIGHVILKKIKHEKIPLKYGYYLIALIISGLFIFLSPGNNNRMIADSVWSSLSILGKLRLSLPVVSYNLFNFRDYKNVIPIFYILAICYQLFKNKKLFYGILLLAISVIAAITDNMAVYISVAIVAFFMEALIHIKKGNINLIIISLGFYAMVYSTVIVPNYADARPNLFFYLYAIIVIILFFSDLIKMKYTKYALVVGFILLLGFEISIYSHIGSYHEKRLKAIDNCIKDNCTVLRLPKIPEEYSLYHVDSNSPVRGYYTYQFYLQYYKLPDDIVIKYE